jgi:hypothetical protein
MATLFQDSAQPKSGQLEIFLGKFPKSNIFLGKFPKSNIFPNPKSKIFQNPKSTYRRLLPVLGAVVYNRR